MKQNVFFALALCIMLFVSACRPNLQENTEKPAGSPIPESPARTVTVEPPVSQPPPTSPDAPDFFESPVLTSATTTFDDNSLVIEEDYWNQRYFDEVSGQLLLEVSCAFPELSGDYPAAARVFFNQLREQTEQKVDSILSDARELFAQSLEGAYPFMPFSYSEDYIVERNDGVYLSIRMESDAFLGGAHGSGTVRSGTFHLGDSRGVTLDDLFNAGRNEWVALLSALICEEISQNPDGYFPGYEETVPVLLPDTTFCLTDDALVLYFQEYELAPYAAGVSRFEYTTASLGEIWKN